jgi:hypothetical protein
MNDATSRLGDVVPPARAWASKLRWHGRREKLLLARKPFSPAYVDQSRAGHRKSAARPARWKFLIPNS